MLDYDSEAVGYDASRGGEARAEVAADAVETLLPADARTVLDLACGTGIVTRHLCRPGRTVLGVDRSAGMIRLGAERLPGRVLLGDATRLPVAADSVDAVVAVWLLHLVDDAAPVLAECARVLRPGGTLITTVNKNAATFRVASDIAAVTAPLRKRHAPPATDGFDHLVELAARHGLGSTAETEFVGIGQGRSPRQWLNHVDTREEGWLRPASANELAALRAELSALPGQDDARPDPRYRVIALT